MFCLEREHNVYVCRVVGLRITGGKREEQDWPKGLEQLGTTWPDLDEVYLLLPGGGRALVSSQVTATRGRPLDIVASFSRTGHLPSSHHRHLGFYHRALSSSPSLFLHRAVFLCVCSQSLLAERGRLIN